MKKQSGAARIVLIIAAIAIVVVILIFPLVLVLAQALAKGFGEYAASIADPYTIKALQLTLLATGLAVAVNTFFGLAAAWAVTRYQFRGKHLLTTFIDIPFAISPVIAGLIFILTVGRIGWLYPFLDAHNIKIAFAWPGVVLCTIFVTFPFIAREIIPVLEARGTDEEEAAALMGAGSLRIFSKITFPHIKWAFLYGVILCAARAMGEFGAVSVISGHLRGKTNTLPLQIEILYNDFKFTSAFAVSSLLVIMAVVVLVVRNIIEYKGKKESGGYVR